MREPAKVTVDRRIASAAESLLPMIVDNLHDAVLITEGEAGASGSRLILFVNRAFTVMTGFTAEEALLRTPDLTIGPNTDPAALQRIQAARASRVPIREELLKVRKDGSTFWAELDVLPVLDARGLCTHFIGVMRDVTERRLVRSRAASAERAAEVSGLVAGLAHEINNPLAALMSNLEWLARRIPPEDRTVFGEAQQAASRIATIVRELRVVIGAGGGSEPPEVPSVGDQPVRAKVLIVDDDDLVLRSVARVVGKKHDVATASSAALALLAIGEQATPFDAVVCDVTMPGIDGLGFYDQVRRLGSGLERKIIFMTGGTGGLRDPSDHLAHLPNPCIEKPIRTPSLFAAIETVARSL